MTTHFELERISVLTGVENVTWFLALGHLRTLWRKDLQDLVEKLRCCISLRYQGAVLQVSKIPCEFREQVAGSPSDYDSDSEMEEPIILSAIRLRVSQ